MFDHNALNRLPTVSLGATYGVNYGPASWPWGNADSDKQVRDDVFRPGRGWRILRHLRWSVQQPVGRAKAGRICAPFNGTVMDWLEDTLDVPAARMNKL